MIPAAVLRVVRLGFEVRVELRADSGEGFAAQLARHDADALALAPGSRVFARVAPRSTVLDDDPALAI